MYKNAVTFSMTLLRSEGVFEQECKQFNHDLRYQEWCHVLQCLIVTNTKKFPSCPTSLRPTAVNLESVLYKYLKAENFISFLNNLICSN